jgi:hypothetical protein
MMLTFPRMLIGGAAAAAVMLTVAACGAPPAPPTAAPTTAALPTATDAPAPAAARPLFVDFYAPW